ncbi:WD40 repeat-like protein [Mycena belliarum]|uniref:WD40 repeat-like protein n=1 Tax=Mycena belliarum TaxID=1033014 RepID=A0AAD6XUA8_9AGAR|nr:WD40 repeat-like protein [Mycena belliae]
MAAATTTRQPHEIPLPHSPAHAKPQRQMASRKGKGKAKEALVAPKRRVQVSQSDASSSSSWDWISLTDSVVSTVPPIFTKDGSYFFSLVGNSVRIYAVTTGKVVSTLSIPRPAGFDASSDTLTCAVLNPHNAFQLITGSVGGVLAVWDFLEATLLQIVDIAQPIHHICVHETFKDSVFVTASRPNKKGVLDDNAIVLQVSLKPADVASQSTIQKSSDITAIGKIRMPTGLSFSPSGTSLVAIAGHKAYVASSASFAAGFTKYVSPERLTCLAFHPSEEYFATGDEKGNIRLWYCLAEQLPIKPFGVEKKTQTTTLHWHAHAVSSIAFTPNGAYLLSGGEESVLVVWQLHSGKREFLPRIGSPIKTISVSKAASGEEEYLLGLADATYTFVGAASLKISRTYSRIKLDPSAVQSTPSTSTHSLTPLSVHSTTSTLILPSSHPSSLQIYSPISSTLVSELEVSPSNRVSRRDEKPIDPCRIERVTISPSGDWLATIDTREGDEGAHGESYLKIWWWDRKAGFWILNTRVDRPHGLEKVTDAAFSPSPEGQPMLLVTTGKDCNTKTWRIRTAKDNSEFWIARSTSSFQRESPSHASWSPDGSLLAITLPKRVALFTPSTNFLRHTLAFPECGVVRAAHFIGKAGRYLAVVGAMDIVLWDLVGQRVRWQHKTSSPIQTLVSHPREDTFAVVLSSSTEERSKSKVMLFMVGNAQPLKTLVVPFGFRNIAWYPLVASSFSLVAITNDWKVVVVGESIHIPKDEGSVSRGITALQTPQRRTLFQDIFGKSAFGEQALPSQPSAPASIARPWTGRAGTEVFDGPAYLMPPLESLFESLMNGFLKPRVVEAPALPSTVPADEDVDMGGDEIVSMARRDIIRVVDQKELGAMVDLFKAHTLKAKVLPLPLGTLSKKKGLVNGHTDGASARVSSTPLKPNGVVGLAASSSPANISGDVPAPSSTPLVNGKKRKKSMG